MPLTFKYNCLIEKFMKQIAFFTLTIFVSLFLFSSRSTLADVVCQPVYGGGQNCVTVGNILVNKMVQNPQTGQFIDNLGINDPKFTANQSVTFQINLTNTGSAVIQQTAVRDTFPGFVSFTAGNGNFDSNTKTLTFTTDSLNPGETRTFSVQGQIVDAKGLPDNVTCVVNQVTATTNTGQMSQDNAQFCIQKAIGTTTTKGGLPVLPAPKVTSTPPTGPELLPLIGLLPAGLSGWFMRKKSKFDFQGGEK